MLEKDRKEVAGVTKLICKISVILFITVAYVSLGGCVPILDNAVSDVGGWDISACLDGFSTCFELFTDNTDKFAAGFEDALSGL